MSLTRSKIPLQKRLAKLEERYTQELWELSLYAKNAERNPDDYAWWHEVRRCSRAVYRLGGQLRALQLRVQRKSRARVP